MFRLKCDVAYDGTAFQGFQFQNNARTIQGVIEEALTDIHKGQMVRIYPSGRTDTGVHARRQVFHFDSDLDISAYGWRRAIGNRLPRDVVLTNVVNVPMTFHARFDAVKKEYRYTVCRREIPDVFRRRYTHHVPYPLDVARIREAADILIGTHDFTSFCATHTNVKTKVRTIETIEISEDGDELMFRFVGYGFLRQMIRIIVGVLLDIGQARKTVADMQHILTARDRRVAGKTAPGHGLTLWDVYYEKDPETAVES